MRVRLVSVSRDGTLAASYTYCLCPLKLDHLLLSNFDGKREGYGKETVYG